jgi:hexosaminidase
MVLPRMLALSEVLWTPKSEKNYVDFYNRLQNQFIAFDEKGFHYCKGNFTVGIKPTPQNGQLFVALSSEIPAAQIYYTTDGTKPDAASGKYETPIRVDSSLTLKAVIVMNGQVMGVTPSEQKFVMDKAVGKNVTYTNPVSRYYPADGPNTLTDGVRGTTEVSKYWHGFQGKDLIATIDMGTATSIKNISISCLQRYSD